MPEDEKSIEQPAFTQRDLPEWVKSLGLPPVANEAIDRYWKPAWDAIKDTLPLLPIHAGRGARRHRPRGRRLGRENLL